MKKYYIDLDLIIFYEGNETPITNRIYLNSFSDVDTLKTTLKPFINISSDIINNFKDIPFENFSESEQNLFNFYFDDNIWNSLIPCFYEINNYDYIKDKKILLAYVREILFPTSEVFGCGYITNVY